MGWLIFLAIAKKNCDQKFKIDLIHYIFKIYYLFLTERLIAYYESWGKEQCPVEKIDPTLFTHLIYAFVEISPEGATIASTDYRRDIQEKNFEKFNNVKIGNNSLKTLASIGGWVQGTKRFEDIAGSPTNRLNFAQAAKSFCVEYGFDGLDVSWLYPNSR
jgi:GH18 family chitinase